MHTSRAHTKSTRNTVWWAFLLRPNAVHRLFVPVCIVSPVVDVQVKCNVQIEYMCNNCACALLLNRPSTRPDGPGRSQIWSEAAGTRLASATAVGPGRASPSCVFYRHLLLPRTITLGDHRVTTSELNQDLIVSSWELQNSNLYSNYVWE